MTRTEAEERSVRQEFESKHHPIQSYTQSFMIKIDFYSSSGSCHSLSLITQAFPSSDCKRAHKSGDGIKELAARLSGPAETDRAWISDSNKFLISLLPFDSRTHLSSCITNAKPICTASPARRRASALGIFWQRSIVLCSETRLWPPVPLNK
jgi:hypothetical protein